MEQRCQFVRIAFGRVYAVTDDVLKVHDKHGSASALIVEKFNASGALMTATSKTKARRQLADVFMKDAVYEGVSWRRRIDAAFDVVYLYALLLLGEMQADTYEHPDPRALVAVANGLGWSTMHMSPAIFHIEHRDDPAVALHRYGSGFGRCHIPRI